MIHNLAETKRMVAKGYLAFYSRRGQQPVQVPTTHLMSLEFNTKPFRVSESSATPKRGR